MAKIPKKNKPQLELGEIEDDDMVITDEWIEHADETLEQKEHRVIAIIAHVPTDSKMNYENHRLPLSAYDYHVVFASREDDMAGVWRTYMQLKDEVDFKKFAQHFEVEYKKLYDRKETCQCLAGRLQILWENSDEVSPGDEEPIYNAVFELPPERWQYQVAQPVHASIRMLPN
ncbi:MAG: hypothetical protein GY847_28475, partial [Proteobacteria bacterium]|nr:hypothetical protein [Pseudomonadota bacterium]